MFLDNGHLWYIFLAGDATYQKNLTYWIYHAFLILVVQKVFECRSHFEMWPSYRKRYRIGLPTFTVWRCMPMYGCEECGHFRLPHHVQNIFPKSAWPRSSCLLAESFISVVDCALSVKFVNETNSTMYKIKWDVVIPVKTFRKFMKSVIW